MNTNNDSSRELLRKYMDNSISKDELRQLLQYFDVDEPALEKGEKERLETYITEALGNDIGDMDPIALSAALAKADKKLRQRLSGTTATGRNVLSGKRRLYRYAAAAALLLFAGTMLYTYLGSDRDTGWTTTHTDTPSISPGSNKATLSLAGGETYILSESQEEIITAPQGIHYVDGSPVVENMTPTLATLVIPRGGHYQITLPDGTKVYLNSGSTLRYPTAFDDQDRVVELSGEAYFAVTSDPERRFIVKSDRQEIHVLGTRFNVYHYEGEPIITTLVDGEVQIQFDDGHRAATSLRPGQQAIFSERGAPATIREVNPEDYTSWTQDLFVFNNLSLTAIMKQLERWYDITVTYSDDVDNFQNEHFFAEIPRDRTLSEVLRQLERSGNFTFEQKGRRIIVHQ